MHNAIPAHIQPDISQDIQADICDYLCLDHCPEVLADMDLGIVRICDPDMFTEPFTINLED